MPHSHSISEHVDGGCLASLAKAILCQRQSTKSQRGLGGMLLASKCPNTGYIPKATIMIPSIEAVYIYIHIYIHIHTPYLGTCDP